MKNQKVLSQFGPFKILVALILFSAITVIIFSLGGQQSTAASRKTAPFQTDPASVPVRGTVILQTGNKADIVTVAATNGQKVLAAPDGSFEIPVKSDAPYHLTISAPGYLRAEITGTAPANGAAIELAEITLLHGDATGNNLIDIFDLAFFGNHFFSGNFLADGNRDSLIDIVDVTTVAANYGERGPRLDDLDMRLQRLTRQLGLSPLQAVANLNPAKVELGRILFFDKELGGNRDAACATCHLPSQATGDGLPLAIGTGGTNLGPNRIMGAGREFIARNAPEVFNRGSEEWHTMFWDNRVSGNAEDGFITPAGDQFPPGVENVVAAQAMFPVTSRDEMRGVVGDVDVFGQFNEVAAIPDEEPAAIWAALTERLKANPEYMQLFASAFPEISPEALGFQHAANAIAAFEIDAFTFTNSPWDRYLAGETTAMTPEAKAGALLFFGQANCSRCHAGNLFTDQLTHNICAPQIGPGKGDAAPHDVGRGAETGLEEDMFAFRTPPLRNVSLSGPWTHAGAYNSLEDVVRHHLNPELALKNFNVSQLRPDLQATFQTDAAALDTMLQNIDPLLGAPQTLSDEQVGQLVAFLEALTDPAATDMSNVAPASVPSGLLIDQ